MGDFLRLFYTTAGSLHRLEFLICMIAMWLFLSLLFLIVVKVAAVYMPGYVFAIKVFFPLISVLMYTPLFLKRLRDIGWQKKLVVLFYIAALFNFNTMELLGIMIGALGLFSLYLPSIVATLSAFLLLLLLFFIKGKKNDGE